MGKRSRQRMTGLSDEKRSQQSIEREAEKRRKRAELFLKRLEQKTLEAPQGSIPTIPIVMRHENLPDTVKIAREQVVLGDIERRFLKSSVVKKLRKRE